MAIRKKKAEKMREGNKKRRRATCATAQGKAANRQKWQAYRAKLITEGRSHDVRAARRASYRKTYLANRDKIVERKAELRAQNCHVVRPQRH